MGILKGTFKIAKFVCLLFMYDQFLVWNKSFKCMKRKVTGSSLISAVVQVGLRVPTPHAEEVLSVHLRVPSLAPGGCIVLAQRPT